MSPPTILMPTYQSSSSLPSPRDTRAARRVRPTSTKVSSTDVSPFYDDEKWKLFVTTGSQICAWDSKGCDPIFTSSSRGIVAAKPAQDGSTLAIADAQVIMLHQIKDGQDKSYRLKGAQRCRLLQHSHDCNSLFYTDALHNSVQVYSLLENRVTDAAKSHPSPINNFATSCDSNLILSASSNPPTIQVHNQLHATTISLAPSASATPVVACAFHPSRKYMFVLAFGDGVLAAYDYNNLSKPTKENSLDIPKCHPKSIHAFKHLHNPNVADPAEITSVEFIPRHKSRAITVGKDGRCFLVDFEQQSVVGSWHIGAPATSLSLRDIKLGPPGRKKKLGGFLIAIGTVHGRCVIYDGNANKVAEKAIDLDGDAVLDVEWVYGDVTLLNGGDIYPLPELTSPVKATSKLKEAGKKNGRLGTRQEKNSLYEHGNNLSISLPPPLEETDHNVAAMEEPVTKRRGLPKAEEIYEVSDTQGYMDLFSPVKKRRAPKPMPNPAPLPEKKAEKETKPSDSSDHRSAVSAPQVWEEPSKKGRPKTKAKDSDNPLEDKTDVSDVFQTQTASYKQTTGEETFNSKEASTFNATSVSTGPVGVKEGTTDGKLLSEIRSIRAKVESGRASRAANSTLALTSQYLPTRGRTAPVSRTGTIAEDSRIGKTTSLPGQLSSQDIDAVNSSVLPPNIGNYGQEIGHETGHETVTDLPGLHTDETQPDLDIEETVIGGETTLGEETVLPDSNLDDAEEDIWLAASTRTRKRKPRSRLVDEAVHSSGTQPGSDINLAHSSSIMRSSKSRKTVTWSSSSGTRPSSQPSLPTPGASMSEPEPVTKPLSLAKPLFSTNTTSSSDHTSTHIPHAPRPAAAEQGQSLDASIKSALVDMQAAMLAQMQTMQDEMQRQFQTQNRELLALHKEVGRVREENGELRRLLAEK